MMHIEGNGESEVNGEASSENALSPTGLNETASQSENSDFPGDPFSLQEKIYELDKRITEQSDEIVCLRGTLADSLRRITLLEDWRTNDVPARSYRDNVIRHKGALTPREPARREPKRHSTSNFTPQRSSLHLSTSSLFSESGLGLTPTRTPASRKNSFSSPSNLASKRWSSSSDFYGSSTSLAGGRHSASRLRGVPTKTPEGRPVRTSLSRAGLKELSFNPSDGSIRGYLRGRPVVFYAPSNVTETYSLAKLVMPPSRKLKLDWVYGYRGRDCRNNLFTLPTGEIVYFVAAVVILYNKEDQMQRHYLGHTDDIKCMTLHPSRLVIATGQVTGHDRGEKREALAHVRVWDSVTLNTLHVIGCGDFGRGVSCLAFSVVDGGTRLCVVDDSNDHLISVWEWQRGDGGRKIMETKGASDTILSLEWHPLDNECFVTCGKGHIHFWTMKNGGINRRLGVLEARDKPRYITCLSFTESGDILSGDSNGSILVWSRGGNSVSRSIRSAHEGSCFALCVQKDGSLISGGGKDGRIVEWDRAGRKTGREIQLPDGHGGVRTLCLAKGTHFLIGTTRNDILLGDMDLTLSLVISGHKDEIWALSCHPQHPQFLTGGYDNHLKLWDSISHSLVWIRDIGESIQSATFSPDGTIVILGTLSGQWVVMDAETREVHERHADGVEPLQVLAYSPNGSHLALGSRDNNIYIYQPSEDFRKYSKVGKCTGHTSFITHLDWSYDSALIQSNSGDYETLYWNPSTCRQITQPSQLRDVDWATQSCTLNFSTIGIWPEGVDGTDINACCKSPGGDLLATADDSGKVKLFSYPACHPNVMPHTYQGHSSHVTGVQFIHDGRKLLSIGGKDSSIFQWSIE